MYVNEKSIPKNNKTPTIARLHPPDTRKYPYNMGIHMPDFTNEKIDSGFSHTNKTNASGYWTKWKMQLKVMGGVSESRLVKGFIQNIKFVIRINNSISNKIYFSLN
jgi:hypothetical protein